LLPKLTGRPIRVELRDSLGSRHLAATNIRRRLILLDREVLETRGDFERIMVHEIFHFVWVHLSNSARRDWERLLASELARRAPGELGWSAEWRKDRLKPRSAALRTMPWRHYACEAFCDSAAWMYARLRSHEEFTLPGRFRRARREWFRANLLPPLSI
jgi:hypothetical protein